MRTERDTARVMRDWMQEPAELDDRGVHAVLDRLPDTPQRRHRWLWPFDWRPFGSGATRSADTGGATAQRRYLSMFTATRMAALTAVLALTGSLALMVGPLDRTETVLAPGAVQPEVLEPAHFTGRTTASGRTGGMEVLPDRTTDRWESTFTNTMSDARMSGSGTSTNYLESIDVGAGKLMSHASKGELVNEDGSYGLACTGAGATGMMDTDWDPLGVITCWYEGQDGYEGLVAYTVLTSSAPLTGIWDVEGWIWEGELPTVEYEPEAG